MKLSYFILLLSVFPCAADTAITENELIRRTQQLMDSLVPGDQRPWKEYFAEDCIFADEKGRILDKTNLVADIAPMPAGYTGAIQIDHVQTRIIGDIAVLSYDANETETIFGQKMQARYHLTDTWLRRHGSWQIIASQAHRYYEDPAVGKADPTKFADYIGVYELAPGQTKSVIGEGGKLFIQRKTKVDHSSENRAGGEEPSPDKPPQSEMQELLPETCDLFFRKGIEGRILFRRDGQNKVDALIDRRNNEDVIWRKINDR